MPETMPPSPSTATVKQALLEIRRLSQRVDELEQGTRAPIAVIGAGVRFPGDVHNLDDLWALLANGVHAAGPVPMDRWDLDRPPALALSTAAQKAQLYGGFLKDIQGFDAHFFGISPREAETMDPQQRLLLEVTWEALENAAQAPERLFERACGVFLGICGSDYYRMLLADPSSIDHYTTTGNALSVAAGRISYLLGLHGPNLAVDTACSSSLVALHLAVNSLRKGECELALVGGVNLILSPEITQNFANAGMLAEDGRCKTFDVSANGYVRSEGCAAVVLKRLNEAQRDGDRILGVIRGTAINHDGRSGGLTAPNGPAQEAVIAAALADANLRAAEVGYVEAHGTGTALGDPIEAGALVNIFCRERDPAAPLLVGSIKTNLGHLEAAAGLAGLLKTLLILKHGCVPAHLHLQRVSPYLNLDGAPLKIPTELTSWPDQTPLLAGVSSFGLSGTNAHIVVGAAPQAEGLENRPVQEPKRRVLPLSARSLPALKALAGGWESYLERLPAQDFASACRAATLGRSHFHHRLALTAASPEEARQALTSFLSSASETGFHVGESKPNLAPTAAFLFTGQGSNYAGMGWGLYESEAVFRAAMDECAELFAPFLERPLLAALYPEQVEGGDPSLLRDMAYAQAGLFSLQTALARLWKSWGIQPSYLLGHSAGEYAAAVQAEVFSLEAAVHLVTARSLLMSGGAVEGRMATVFAEAAVVEAAMSPYPQRLSVAAYNGPKTVVISGEQEAMARTLESLSRQGVKSRLLEIAQAAHSPLIEPILDAFAKEAAAIRYAPARSGFASTVLGRVIEADEIANPDYWRRHLRQPVRFMEAVSDLYQHGVDVFIEMGPNPALLALGERCLPRDAAVTWLPSLRKGQADQEVMLDSLAAVYSRGAQVRWEVFSEASVPPAAAPTYPFQHERYWAAAAEKAWSKGTDTGRAGPPGGADPAATWKAVLAAGEFQAAQAPLDLSPESYAEIWQQLDRLTFDFVLKALRELEIFSQAGEWLTPEQAANRAKILPTYQNLLSRWLNLLASKGALESREGAYRALHLPDSDLDRILGDTRARLSGLHFLETYLVRCGSQLGEVLTGKANPLDTLFPGGSFELAEALYGQWPLSRYFSGLVRSVVESVVRSRGTSQPVRILELGAGTGGTTQAVAPALNPAACSYTFTDVSEMFLRRAAQKFSPYPFMNFSSLDIEKTPQEQGIPAHQYDIVIAANVLHATRDLRQTLAHVKQLLAPGGVLVATEATTYYSWFDVTTGLIAGWQRFEDGLRQDHPLLPAERWLALLQEMGFESSTCWPEADSPATVLGQTVLAAMSLEAGPQAPANGETGGRFQQKETAARPAEPAEADTLAGKLRAALSDEREELLLGVVRAELGLILHLGPAAVIGADSPLHELGVDSLMSLELRRNLSVRLDLPEDDLPSTLVFDFPTPKRLAGFLCGFFAETEQEIPDSPGVAKPGQAAVNIDDLNDEEVAALLMKKLKDARA